jgi:hypothetical protein
MELDHERAARSSIINLLRFRSSFRSSGIRIFDIGIFCKCLVAAFLVLGCAAHGQDYYTNQEVRVSSLPTLVARSHAPSDVLKTSLATILDDRSVCCGKDSVLEDSVEKADPLSLKDIAAKLQGKHLRSDGRPIMVKAMYVEPQAINSGMLITTLRVNHPLLLAWNSHLYVCYGVTYVKNYDPNTGAEMDAIHKFLLLDTRYSDSRREAVFNRETDDWSKVQGMIRFAIAQQ